MCEKLKSENDWNLKNSKKKCGLIDERAVLGMLTGSKKFYFFICSSVYYFTLPIFCVARIYF